MRTMVPGIGRHVGSSRFRATAWFLRATLFGLVLLPLGCGYANLDSVVVNNRLAGRTDPLLVEVLRAGEPVPSKLSMALNKGDDIKTPAGVIAVLQFHDGSEVTMMPETSIHLTNPSIKVWFGRIIERLKGGFRTEGDLFDAAAVGTTLILDVQRDGSSTITLIEGRIILSSPDQRWPSVSLSAGQQARIGGSQKPQVNPIPPDEYNETIRFLNDLQRTTGRERAGLCVPRVLHMSADRAREVLQSAGFAIGDVQRTIEDDDDLVNRVVRQDPEPGANARAGSPVRLWIRARAVVAPNVVGRPLSEAEYLLRQAGLQPPEKTQQRIEGKYPPGTVIEQSPTSGQRVPEGGTVRLTTEAESVLLPTLTGLPVEQAEEIARQQKCLPSRRTTGPQMGIRTPQVVRQDPASGTRVKPGTTVYLYLAVPGVEVPPLLGKSRREAEMMLSRTRLRAGSVSTEPSPSYTKGAVTAQSPPAGQVVEYDSAVNLTLSSGPSYVLDRTIPFTPLQPNLTVTGVTFEYRSSLVTYSLRAEGRLPQNVTMAIQVQHGRESQRLATWRLGQDLLDQLNTGRTITESRKISIPYLGDGDYVISVSADIDNDIQESNEQDNRRDTRAPRIIG